MGVNFDYSFIKPQTICPVPHKQPEGRSSMLCVVTSYFLFELRRKICIPLTAFCMHACRIFIFIEDKG